jgi:uncharacterized membrane protein YfcA
MDALTAWEIAYFVFIIVFSFSLRGSAGFGGLNGPLLMVVLPAKIVVPALVFLGIVSSGAIVVRDHPHIQWRAVARTLPYGLAGTAIGLWLFDSLDARSIERGLGVFLLVYGTYALWRIGRPPSRPLLPQSTLAGIAGTTAGIVGTMFGTMAGVFVAVFLDALKLAKQHFRATMAATLLILGIVRAIGYVSVGAVTEQVLITIAVAMPLLAIGIVLGNRLHATLNQQGFNRLVGVLFVVIGTYLSLRQ